jgi:hypothetical protein
MLNPYIVDIHIWVGTRIITIKTTKKKRELSLCKSKYTINDLEKNKRQRPQHDIKGDKCQLQIKGCSETFFLMCMLNIIRRK